MLIKIGDCWVDPEEIEALATPDKNLLSFTAPLHAKVSLVLKDGIIIYVQDCEMEQAEAALRAAGLIEADEEDFQQDPPELTDEERLELKNLQAYGYEWIARDKNGHAYAYWDPPEKDRTEWTHTSGREAQRLANLFDFLDWEDEKPMSIAWLIGVTRSE